MTFLGPQLGLFYDLGTTVEPFYSLSTPMTRILHFGNFPVNVECSRSTGGLGTRGLGTRRYNSSTDLYA